MKRLGLDLFISGEEDLELAQYRILGGLQQVRRAYAGNRVYPHLTDLMRLDQTLRGILRQSRDIDGAAPQRIKSVDWESKTLIYEKKPAPEDHALIFEDLIEWALPLIEAAISEGETLCEFFDGHLNIEQVGIIPAYVDEGYLLVPDEATKMLHVIRYQVSIFTGADERYRSLKTTHVRAIPQGGVRVSPHEVKLQLVEENTDLPNPATFIFTPELEMPFDQTLLPIAKRRLLRHLVC